jgi:BlaI family penicillinase repressor
MSHNAKLTPVEWEIMTTIWDLKKPCSVRDVCKASYPNGEKAYTTIQTIMNTLEKKGVLKREKIGLVNFYTPQKSREKIIRSEMAQVVSRMFEGSVPALANFLINSENLSLDELKEIKSILDKKEKALRSK